MMAKTTLAGLALAVLIATPAAAQMPSINMMPEVKTKSAEEKEREATVEKAYRDQMRKIPDAKAAADPWGDVRGNEAAKSATKAAPKAKPAASKRAKADTPAN